MEEGHYRYWHDLHELEATATGWGPSFFRPATPLRLQAWQTTQTSLSPSIFSMALLTVSILGPTEPSDCAATPRTCRQFVNTRSSSRLTLEQNLQRGACFAPCLLTCPGWSRLAKAPPAREMEVDCGPVFPDRGQCQ